ncbi:MAG: DSD1 family PLP-dependent enzyme [Candidatus Latescibacteria bacterium]|nr:DSD1 family PLP-dependent enzyme [Candidatus Latescibacterota bacterium]
MRNLIGVDTSVIDTPALVIDIDVMEANIAKMASFFRDRPANLRPHTKTPKTPAIAWKQIEAGAIGITCAKLGEAEVMADAGIRDILIANQVVAPEKIERLMEVAKRSDVIVAVDSQKNIDDLAKAARATGVDLKILVEVDIGMHRCGIDPGEPAVELTQHVCRSEGLRFVGVMGYEGHLVMTVNEEERRTTCREAMGLLTWTADEITRSGIDVEIVSGGGTGTYKITGAYPGVTEVQAGSYVFNDGRYRTVEGVGSDFGCALTLLTTVISRPKPDLAVIDAGMKAITKEFGLPQVVGLDGSELFHLSEEHGRITLNGTAQDLKIGDKIELLPSHGCTTINLHDRFYGVRHGKVEVMWPIEARGKCQ